MKEENKPIIKNLIYFFSGMVVTITLCVAFCVITGIDSFSKEFYLAIATGAAIYFTGFRSANIGKPLNITNYLYQRKPLECDMIATEAIGISIVKRSRESKEEARLQKEITDRMASIKSKIEAGESQ